MNPAAAGRAKARYDTQRDSIKALHKVGEGAFSEVFVGHYVGRPDEHIAIKQLKLGHTAAAANNNNGSADSQQRARAERHNIGVDASLLWELECMDLVHPNLIAFHSVTLKFPPPSLLIYMPYLPHDLKHHTWSFARRGGFPADRVVAVFRQVLSGVLCLHRNGVVHRDLKPQNIMVACDEGSGGGGSTGAFRYSVRVIDFGWARRYGGPQASAMCSDGVAGTPAYRGPEALTQDARGALGPPFDVFALGCTLHELLSGRVMLRFKVDKDECRREVEAQAAPGGQFAFHGYTVALRALAGVIGYPRGTFPPACHAGHAAFRTRVDGGEEGVGDFCRTKLGERLRTAAQREAGPPMHESCAARDDLWTLAGEMVQWAEAERPTAAEALASFGGEEEAAGHANAMCGAEEGRRAAAAAAVKSPPPAPTPRVPNLEATMKALKKSVPSDAQLIRMIRGGGSSGSTRGDSGDSGKRRRIEDGDDACKTADDEAAAPP
eukprot:Rhum_TRINITY_DN12538_c0_g2::Rhum_TRINITY_DN12538_c0_g2_i2::g.52852::m.52852/K02208/CDK8_11; cyclin-dependent kinase 8/11